MSESSNLSLIRVSDDEFEEFRDVFEFWSRKSRVKENKEEMFKKGIAFAKALVVTKSRTEAYRMVYGEPSEQGLASDAYKLATSLLSKEWMVLIMDKVQESQYSLFFDKRLEVLDEAYEESINGSGRTKIDAMNLFLTHTKAPETQKVEITHTHEAGDSLANKLEETIKMLAGEGKIVDPSGEIVDVSVIED